MAIAKGQWLAWSILYTIETVAAFLAGSHMYASRKPGPARLIYLLCVSLAFRSAWCYEHEGTQDETWYGTTAWIAHALTVPTPPPATQASPSSPALLALGPFCASCMHDLLYVAACRMPHGRRRRSAAPPHLHKSSHGRGLVARRKH